VQQWGLQSAQAVDREVQDFHISLDDGYFVQTNDSGCCERHSVRQLDEKRTEAIANKTPARITFGAKLAIDAVDCQKVTSEPLTVTAEGAGCDRVA